MPTFMMQVMECPSEAHPFGRIGSRNSFTTTFTMSVKGCPSTQKSTKARKIEESKITKSVVVHTTTRSLRISLTEADPVDRKSSHNSFTSTYKKPVKKATFTHKSTRARKPIKSAVIVYHCSVLLRIIFNNFVIFIKYTFCQIT